jgi:hypothetical protein
MRARLLKPGFFTNEDLAQLPVRARLLFAGLWGLADREGRLEHRPQRIKAAIFPYERVRIEPLIAALVRAGFVLSYTAAYTPCLALPRFAKNQHPHPREPASILPPPPAEPCNYTAGLVPSPAEAVPRSSRDQDQDPPRAARTDAGSPPAPRPVYMPPFKVYCAIARRICEHAPQVDLGALAEQFKAACAAARLPYDGEITRKAIDAVLTARRRRA